jgi:hypothetical protein
MSFQGHLIKYKDTNGNWIEIPVAVGTAYTMYKSYCQEHGIESVSEETYYATLGNLQLLVNQLAGSSDALQSMSAALRSGALPTNMGATGVAIGPEEYAFVLVSVVPENWGIAEDTAYENYYKYSGGSYIKLSAWEAWEDNTFYLRKRVDFVGDFPSYLTTDESQGGLGLINNLELSAAITASTGNLLNKNKIAYGDKNPDDPNSSLPAEAEFYFQYK